MRGHTHAILGLAGALALDGVMPFLPSAFVPLAGALSSAVVGGLAPDIDSDESKARRMTGTNRRSGLLGRLASLVLPRHRGITHEPVALILLAALAAWLRHPAVSAFAVGYATHLAADALTVGGIPCFGRRLHLLPRWSRITTGSAAEHLLAASVCVWLGAEGMKGWGMDGRTLSIVWRDILGLAGF
jgi:inner membrane protein